MIYIQHPLKDNPCYQDPYERRFVHEIPDELAYYPMRVWTRYYLDQDCEVPTEELIRVMVDISSVHADSHWFFDVDELKKACESAARDYLIGCYGRCDYVEVFDYEAINS